MKQFLFRNNFSPEPSEETQKGQRFLLGQLAAYGDCLYATTIARQIKKDFPECHLTWAIGSMCRLIIDGNPHVDDIWEIPLEKREEVPEAWDKFERESLERRNRGDFDEVYFTQISPNNFHNFDGTVRSSIFRAYPRPITVPVSPVLRLSASEIENVHHFAQVHGFDNKACVILFEYSFESGQSFVTLDFAHEVAKRLVREIPDAFIILSSNMSFQPNHVRIIDGSVLSFRENAELTKYCSLLVGCSSGISWLSTSDWAKPLPMIQLLNRDTSIFASFTHDFEYHGLPTDAIIEMTDCTSTRLVNCIIACVNRGYDHARLKYHEQIPLNFDNYINFIIWRLKGETKGKYVKAFRSLINTIKRYGLHPKLIEGLFSKMIYYSRKLPSRLKTY